jgi:Uma2 family endonuclease
MGESARKLTYEDYLLFPDDGKRHELIDGEHLVTPAPHSRHQWVLQNLFLSIAHHVRESGLGRVYIAPVDVIFSSFDVVEPDLLFVSSERLGIIDANVRGAPDLAVEVLSPSSRRQDEVAKRSLYERGGVVEYWVVDPESETVKVYRREGDRFTRPVLLTLIDGDRVESPLFPGLEIPLAAIFAP